MSYITTLFALANVLLTTLISLVTYLITSKAQSLVAFSRLVVFLSADVTVHLLPLICTFPSKVTEIPAEITLYRRV